jgi:transcriptional regulator with XRE-family HTH domain
MQQRDSERPFKPLGSHLKYLREQLRESVAEVSGAVEIDMEDLERIEQGKERPTEDVLMLLINHFDMQDTEAVQLWELAGYEGDKDPMAKLSGKPLMVLLAMDMRTQYTDHVEVEASKTGVTMNFSVGKDHSVARVGMSREQAQEVISALQTALLKSQYLDGPKQLPESSSEK